MNRQEIKFSGRTAPSVGDVSFIQYVNHCRRLLPSNLHRNAIVKSAAETHFPTRGAIFSKI